MGKKVYTTYLLGNSVLLFGCLLAIGKGFDLVEVLKTKAGFLFILLLFFGTFALLSYSPKLNTGKTKKKSPETFQFGDFEVDKKLIESFLSSLIHKDDELVKITYTMYFRLINVNVFVKKIEQVNVSELVEQLKKQIQKGLEEKFGAKEDVFEIKFNVQEYQKEE